MIIDRKLVSASLILWVILFLFGLQFSRLKPLWNDELYTQVTAIDKLSFGEILAGKVNEGNNLPFFYLIQKSFCTVLNYKLPFVWEGDWYVAHPQAQIILRIVPNLFMSLAIVLMFYFFAQRSWRIGFYAVLLMLSSSMIWQYWAEARPYGLWILLSTLQVLLFWKFLEYPQGRERIVLKMGLCHILLSLTVLLGIIQVFIVSVLMVLLDRKYWKRILVSTTIAVLLTLFYYFHSPRFQFHLPAHPFNLILENLTPDLILLGCGLLLFRDKSSKYFLTAAALTVLSAMVLLGLFQLRNSEAAKGFEISSRYFLYLIPISVSLAVLTVEKLRGGFLILVGGLLVFRIFNAYGQISGLPYMQGSFLKVDPVKVATRARILSLNQFQPDYQELRIFMQSGYKSTVDFKSYIFYYERMQQTFGDLPEIYQVLGFLYFYDGQKEKARAAFEKALSIDPEFFLSLYNLAVMEYQDRNVAAFLKYLERAIKVQPSEALKQIFSSKVFVQITGGSPESLALVQKSLSLKYGHLAAFPSKKSFPGTPDLF